MADKLQELTERIYQEGVAKSKAEADAILEEARRTAAEIVAKANEEATSLMSKATKDAEELQTKTLSDVKMAAQQAISSAKQQIADVILMRAFDEPIAKGLSDVEFLKKIIGEMVEKWQASGMEALAITLPSGIEAEMTSFFQSQGSRFMEKGLTVSFEQSMGNGFKIGPADGSFRISFTDEDFANYFKHFLRPKAIRVLYGE